MVRDGKVTHNAQPDGPAQNSRGGHGDWSLLRETLAFPLLLVGVLCAFAGVILALSLLPESWLPGGRGVQGIDHFFGTNIGAIPPVARALLSVLLVAAGALFCVRARRLDEGDGEQVIG